MKNLLLIVDMQNDFCKPAGALYVPGAEKDVERLAQLISDKSGEIHHIILTQDNHHLLDIAHQVFWKNRAGEHPVPFENIVYEDIESGKWEPLFHKQAVVDYLIKLKEQGEFPHTIWPVHCLWGSEGAALVAGIMEPVISWARQGYYYDLVSKGIHPLTEHFGAFRATIPILSAPETLLNMPLIDKLCQFDSILIAGEARSHCVANTVKQLFEFPHIVQKLIILNDCMSNVPNCELLAAPIYEKALQMGASIRNADDITL
jgi:nicotinamidase/pyrazinamidase